MAVWTRSRLIPDRFGKPSGNESDLRGCGSGPFLIRISRALEAVPHGGAMCTTLTLFSFIKAKRKSKESGGDKSILMCGPRGASLFREASKPTAWSPAFVNSQVRSAEPQNISKAPTNSCCVLLAPNVIYQIEINHTIPYLTLPLPHL